ncbi:hypothetical protein F5884DRAFT_832161 [Xylogone sp. PMI_703]|nr:hypothetical protein F5884DRAFT_832161 [Xylogone sp. PMI_703]
MGSNDLPPPHVPSHVVPVATVLLQIGGTLWTVCYILYLREALRSKSYGMPIFALAFNFAWEVVYAIYVSEAIIEKTVFYVWLVIDCGLIYSVMKYAKYEWAHAPVVARHIGLVFSTMAVVSLFAQWTFAKWWIDNNIGQKEGKIFRGVVGPDTSELGYWTAAASQIYLSAASLAQLIIRQHSGGVSYGIWASRAIGSLAGLPLCYGWGWYFWREAHEYFMSPFSIFLWVTGLTCDLVYPFVLWQVRKSEKVLPDGRKVRGDAVDFRKNL